MYWRSESIFSYCVSRKEFMTTLSILIPAFNYSKGIERILKSITPLPQGVELIIADDSTDDAVRIVVEKFAEKNILYKKNVPARGAVANWNFLIGCAKGEFIILLHHDELPLGSNFLCRILASLRRTSADVLLMDVLLLNKSLVPIRRHVGPLLRHFVIRFVPGYLFCRNVIGPTAALVVRKNVYPTFDTNLKWLVDVEMYYRLRQNTKNWTALRGFEVGSIQGEHETITYSLRNELKDLEQAERGRLDATYRQASFWISLQSNPLGGACETAVWAGVRAVQIVWFKLRAQKRSA